MPIRRTKVSVFAPARLHMGFLDLSGALGRHFGSIGVGLNEHGTRLSLSDSVRCTVIGPSAPRAQKCVDLLCRALDVPDSLQITIETAIPEHVGLGSGTQMSLAIGSALNAYYDLGMTVRDIASVMDRGVRSGIGIGVFENGGLVVDGGRGDHTTTPPLLVHLNVPDTWRFILVFDKRGQGLHGRQEINAFQQLPPFSRQEAERLCYLLLMQGLPAVAENDIIKFGEVITCLQNSVGEHFSSAQGGVFTSPDVATAMRWLKDRGAVAIGQTSWGPTGFCAVDGPELAESLARHARQRFASVDTLSFLIASPRNTGGEVFID